MAAKLVASMSDGNMVKVVSGDPDDDELVGVEEVTDALRLEAKEFWQRRMASLVEQCARRAHDPGHLIVLCAQVLARSLKSSGYVTSCPVVVLSAGGDDAQMDRLSIDCDRVFSGWQEAVRRQLCAAGFEEPRAASLSSIIVSILQGALIVGRTRLSTAPLEIAGQELADLVRAELSGAAFAPC